MQELNKELMPQHVAIIMDGNGRWAQRHNRPRVFGHKKGAQVLSSIVEYAKNNHIKALTLYAFSSENWQRPLEEVSALMSLFLVMLDSQIKKIHKNNIKLKILGDISKFPVKLQEKIIKGEQLTANNDAMVLNIAANYGGRWDILHGVHQVCKDIEKGLLTVDSLTEDEFANYLTTQGQPDVDLVIRTSGEQRISNFLLWQLAYAELYFTDVLWPDFSTEEFEKAIVVYQTRNRRFGKL